MPKIGKRRGMLVLERLRGDREEVEGAWGGAPVVRLRVTSIGKLETRGRRRRVTLEGGGVDVQTRRRVLGLS